MMVSNLGLSKISTKGKFITISQYAQSYIQIIWTGFCFKNTFYSKLREKADC